MNTASPDYRELANSSDNRDAAVRLVSQARMSLAMFTRDLDPAIYNTEGFAAAVRQLALRSRYAQIRIVVIDPTSAIKDGHRLIELGRRLSSFIEFRRPSAEHAKLPESFLVTDETGLLYRPVASRYEGFVDTANSSEARVRLRLFDEIWAQAEPEPEFRRLGM
ncbi:MAG: hypothetical protein ACRESO_05160 [Gammaproteobacteria bacterium]